MRFGKFEIIIALIVSAVVIIPVVVLEMIFFGPFFFYRVLVNGLIGFACLFIWFAAFFGFLSAKISSRPPEKLFCADCHKNFTEKELAESQFGGFPYDGCPHCGSANISIVETK